MQRYSAMSSYNGNALYGKKWAVCGDSFTPVMIRSMNPDIAEEVKQAVKIKQPARGAAARAAGLDPELKKRYRERFFYGKRNGKKYCGCYSRKGANVKHFSRCPSFCTGCR